MGDVNHWACSLPPGSSSSEKADGYFSVFLPLELVNSACHRVVSSPLG